LVLRFIADINVSSPCLNVCKLDDRGICIGCFRTLDEIARWSQLNDIDKSRINSRLDELKRKTELEQNGEVP